MEEKVSGKSLESASGLQLQRRLLSFLFSKQVPHLPSEDERKYYPETKANILSRVMFWWLHPVMTVGYKRTMEPEDMYKLPENIQARSMAETFYRYFDRYFEKAKRKHIAKKITELGGMADDISEDEEAELLKDFKIPTYLTMWCVFLTFKWQYSLASILLILSNVCVTCTPLLTRRLIRYVEDKAFGLDLGIGKGVGYSFGVSLLEITNGIAVNHFFYRSMLTGAQVKAMLTKALLDKAFRLSAASKQTFTDGKITSMMGTDLARIDFALGFSPFLFTFPVPFAVAIAILVINIGVSSLVGVGLMIAFLALVIVLSKQLFKYRSKANKYTDSRVNYIKEILSNLKVIKFYSWEPPYHKTISEIRKKEMGLIYKMQVMRNLIISFAMSMPLISSMVSFLVLYAIRSSQRDPADIFSSVSLFSVLTQQIIMLPMAVSSGTDAYMGFSRVGEYLACEEINEEEMNFKASPEEKVSMDKENLAIRIKEANFEWLEFKLDEEGNDKEKVSDASSEEGIQDQDVESKKLAHDSESSTSETTFPGLTNIDLDIRKGEFVVITGLIGSGKSSLLSAMSGFMPRSKGELMVNGSLVLCGMPWVQNETVRENIIFGSEFDQKVYDDVVYSSSLESDLVTLPAGDKTEIGERGITLSGGQKARINLARAVYANKDIVLMDDVLSAVDARVGKHIMNTCILGLLKNKTRVLATHQISLIGAADKVVFLNGDGTADVGTFDELKERNTGFMNLMEFYNDEKSDDESVQEEKILMEEDQEIKEIERSLIERQLSKLSTNNGNDEEAIHRDYHRNEAEDGTLVQREERAVNNIKLSVYLRYLKMGSGIVHGYASAIFILITAALATFCSLFTNTWLSFWLEHRFGERTDGFYIGLYVMFCILAVIILLIEFIAVAYLSNKAAIALNVQAVQKVIHAPMAFMDTTPMGRIMNRFTKDTDVLDNEISDQVRFLLYTLANIIGVIILCICYLPWFAIAVPILGFLFVAIANFYQASAREIKRLEAIQRSFVYNNFNEALNGMNTIKAYNHEHRFLSKNENLIDKMDEAYYITIANQRWLSINLNIVAFIMCLVISLLCVNRVFNIGAASVGLVLSYVLQIAGQLSFLIRTYTQVENEMNSVERLCQYAFDLKKEAPYIITETEPSPSWPEKAEVKFDNVSLAYRPGLPLVLKNVNFEVRPGENIGICGRTGAGKSSIISALYRLTELDQGKILIDNVDVSKLGLNALRSKLSIIPQDPVLFRGTIKKNLDPFGEHPDDKLWDGLRRAGLIEKGKLDTVKGQNVDGEKSHKFHLDQSVDEDGSNFSLGERQLLAFARALVRDTKILILDEATSSVDYETDSKIQATIASEFSHCTILCIAHRLKTIINYDKILVLDKGEVMEFDTPWTLFNTKDSIFQQMCIKSNIVTDDFERR